MKTMKSAVTFLLSAVLVLSGCGGSGSAEGSENTGEKAEETVKQKMISPADVTFENRQFHTMNMPVPADWKVEEGDEINFYPPGSNDIVMLICEDVGTDMTGVEDSAFGGMEKSLTEGLESYEAENLTVGGKAARLFTYDMEARSGKIFKINAYGICAGNWIYFFSFGVDDSADVSYRPIYGYMIEHISFEESQSSAVQEPKEETAAADTNVSKEFSSALKSAESYAQYMHMSKAAIFDQLTSEYGDKFPEDAAQYAVDNVKADWDDNALKSAENYAKHMHMSKAAIYDQLISEYGDQFTESQAQYAIDHIEADWNKNALESAKTYLEYMNMSKSAIYDQLISEYGDQFTESEAQYAVDHLE